MGQAVAVAINFTTTSPYKFDWIEANMKNKVFLAGLLSVAVLLSGCATTVKVTSEPAGAMVRLRGEGRAAFRWMTGPTVTPCEMSVYYGRVNVYVIWPADGKTGPIKSEKKEVELSAWRDVETVNFVKP